MKKAHVFKYSQVILTKRELAIIKFSEYSGLGTSDIAIIAINEEKQNGVIDQYKTGKINTEEFRTKINKLIENAGGEPITNLETFDERWNAMCKVEPEKLAELHHLQQKYNNFHIHIIGGTNELQHNYIQREIQKTPNKLNISYTLSYELGTLDNNLLKQNATTYLQQNDYETAWHTDDQHEYEQNALEILGQHYNNPYIDII